MSVPSHPTPSITTPTRTPVPGAVAARTGEDGSMVSEYGLVAVLGATVTALAISWAKGGAIASLLTAVLRQVQQLVLR